MCWGDNYWGESSPPSGGYLQVSASDSNTGHHVCALRTDSTLVCWGRNDQGQATPPAGKFAQVHAGDTFTCAIDDSGREWCWGSIARQPL